MAEIIFWSLSVIAVIFAFMVILSKSPVRSAISLIGVLLAFAGLYLILDSEFIAGIQILIYIGGITVLYMFVISMMRFKKINIETQFTKQWLVAIVSALAFLAEVVYFALKGKEFFKVGNHSKLVTANGLGTIENVGKVLYGKYVLPFEIATVLLLAAIIGTVLLAKREKEKM